MNEKNPEFINLSVLTERQQRHLINNKQAFNKTLTKIHTTIKYIAKQRNSPMYCLYVVPRFIIGSDNYNFEECIVYIVSKLSENGFIVKYTHPDTLFISWIHLNHLPEQKEIIQQLPQQQLLFNNIQQPFSQQTFNNTQQTFNNTTQQEKENLIFKQIETNHTIKQQQHHQTQHFIPTSSVFYNNGK